jgi:thiol:disulfide interchange protein
LDFAAALGLTAGKATMKRRLIRSTTLLSVALFAILALSSALSLAQSTPAVPVPDLAPDTRPASAPAQTQATQRAEIFDPAADAKAQIAAALENAARENQRVLLLLGGNWCKWCHRLHTLFKEDKQIAKTLQYEYQLVLVDVGRFDKNTDLITRYELELKKTGVPFLVVLGSDGKVLARQETGSLEQGETHDPEKVLAFLTQWKAEPRDAETVLKQTLARAAAEHKAILLHLGAPWCPWCRRLDAFLARPEIAPLIGSDFVDLKIDVDRMTNAKDVAARFRKEQKGGIPWLAVLDADGKVVETSDASGENFGYPGAPEEISSFLDMLRKGAKKLTTADFQKIEDALKEAAAKLKPTPATQP